MSIGPKQALFAEFAVIARTLGSPHRLEILEQLGQGERGVEALAERLGLTVANASQHLQQLKRAGLVASRRDKKFILYSLSDASVLKLLRALLKWASAISPKLTASCAATLTSAIVWKRCLARN